MGATRTAPNILITGTPGTGKTKTCELIAEASGARHINVSDLIKSDELHSGWDEEFDCYVLNEDKVCYDFDNFAPDALDLLWTCISKCGPQKSAMLLAGLRCIGRTPE